MATTIGLQETTRNHLEQIKRALGVPSLDATVAALIVEHEARRTKGESARLLLSVFGKRAELARFATRHGIRRIAVFGSALHGDARPDSDLDLLVTFAPSRTPGLIALSALERKLSALLAVKVDVQTLGSFREPLRSRILTEAVSVHDAT